VGVCCGVSVKDGLYTVGISFPRADASNTNSFVSFHAQTRDAKLVPVLQGLKKGDIVRFSGQAEPKTINCYFNLSFVCDVFLLKEISVANQAQTGAGPESAPAAEAAANASKERKAKALLNLAQQYLKAGKPEEARTYAQKVVAEFPETPEAQEATTILQVKP
jgi:hypothetical protein